jgi:hypothetical protein
MESPLLGDSRGGANRERAGPIGACLALALFLAGVVGCASSSSSPVDQALIKDINQRFRSADILTGYVAKDNRGRIELQGEYRDEDEVDKAFSIAQATAGVKWVSPVTPERIQVTEWGQCLSAFLGGKPCGPPQPSLIKKGDETPPGPVEDRYALIVGVGEFRNGITQLRYAEKDAEDMYRYLVAPDGAGFDAQKVTLLQGHKATHGAIEEALDRIQRNAREDDFVLLYFSSHGTPPDKFRGVHIVAYDTEVKPRERVWKTSLTEYRLREFIEGVRAKRLLVVLDACYSNGAYSQVAGFLPTGGKSLGDEDEGQGRSKVDLAQRLLGAKDLVIEEDRPSASSEAGWGKVLISASGAGEKSWESERLHNSFFTYYFVDGLKRHRGDLKESFEYAKPLVTAGVSREKEGALQTPQLTPSRSSWDISITAR